MRFESIELDGFGALRQARFVVGPGLNIIYGQNEAGKSTLQQAIWALLYGFYKTERRNPTDTQMLERFRPWQGDAYGGSLTYRLDNGRAYRVSRNFADQEPVTIISEADTGRDITNTFERGKLGRVNFAHQHFGMSEEVFVNTCFVRQSDLHELAEVAHAISETVVNLAGTGRQDRSVNRALALLEEAFAEQVGTARSRKKPLPLAVERRGQLTAERQRIVQARQDLEAEIQRRGDLLRAQQQANRDLTWLQYSRAFRLHNQVAAQLTQLESLIAYRDQLNTRLAAGGAPNDAVLSQRDTVVRLWQAWSHKREAAERANALVASEQFNSDDLKQRRQTLAAKQLQLEVARDIPLEREAPARALQQKWRDALTAVEQLEADRIRAQYQVAQRKAPPESAPHMTEHAAQAPQQLHQLGPRLHAASRELDGAKRSLAAAEEAWQKLELQEAAYIELQARLDGLRFEDLAELKNKPDSAKNAPAPASRNLRAMGWAMAVIGLVLFAGGALAALAGVGSGGAVLAIAGIAGVIVGLAVAGIGLYLAIRPSAVRVPVLAQAPTQPAELRGFASLAALEEAFHRGIQASGPYKNLARARTEHAARQSDLADIEREVRAILNLAPDVPVSQDLLEAANRRAEAAEEWRQELDQAQRYIAGLDTRLQAARDVLAQCEAALMSLLQDMPVAGSDLAQELQRFYDLCEMRRELEKSAAELRSMDAELKLHLSRQSDAETAILAEDEARRQLIFILNQAGITSSAPQAAFEAFESEYEQAAVRQKLRGELDTLEREIRAALAGRTLEALQQRRDSLARETQSLEAVLDDRDAPPEVASPDELQRRIDEARNNRDQLGRDLALLDQRLKHGTAGLRTLAELDEDLQTLDSDISALQLHGQALQLASEQMAAAADEHHRNFLPQLNRIVGLNLGRVTDGKYASVQIDHSDLQIRLQVPERSTPIIPEVLSRGAQELIYLLLRVGLTELVSSGHERLPLMLDDPLVNFDQARLLRGLEMLSEMADTTQVLLFTKDAATADWARARMDDRHRLLEL